MTGDWESYHLLKVIQWIKFIDHETGKTL
jgi:hypothetical protein